MARTTAPVQGDVFAGAGKPRLYRREVKANGKIRFDRKPEGYAHAPGTGPQGETCGSCANCRFRSNRFGTKRFYKCGLMSAAWTQGRSTDVNVRSPACSSFTPGEPRRSGIVR